MRTLAKEVQASTLLDAPHRLLVPFPHQKYVREIIAGYTAFLNEPDWYKKSWGLGKDREGDKEFGYFHRQKKKGDVDNKRTFHFRPNVPTLLREKGVDFARYEPFLNTCMQVYRICRGITRGHLGLLANEVSRQRGDKGKFRDEFLMLAERADELLLPALRVQEYDDENVAGEIVCFPHADQGLGSLHVYGSEPGLEFGTYREERFCDFEEVDVPDGQALLFGGRKLAHLMGDRREFAPIHQARAHSRHRRRNVVFFDHLPSPALERWYQNKRS